NYWLLFYHDENYFAVKYDNKKNIVDSVSRK
ncbi:MBL fold metallo-hydrolase, partial [Staphylococcus arlettae]